LFFFIIKIILNIFLFFAPLSFGSSIYRQQVTTFSTLAGVGIARGRLSPAKAVDALFTLIRPYSNAQTPRVIWRLIVQTAVIGSASACLRLPESAKKVWATFKQCHQIGQKRMPCIN
jgi:hypothetical protein